jgi:hypothetical protein
MSVSQSTNRSDDAQSSLERSHLLDESHRVTPVSTDTAEPRLSWSGRARRRSAIQKRRTDSLRWERHGLGDEIALSPSLIQSC